MSELHQQRAQYPNENPASSKIPLIQKKSFLVTASIFLVYSAFFILYGWLGNNTYNLTAWVSIPVCLLAWNFGRLPGFIAAVFAPALNILLTILAGGDASAMFKPGIVIGNFLLILFSQAIAYVKTLQNRIQEQLANTKKAEKALRISEERYALAASGANDGLWDWDLSTQKIYFSPRWKSMLGKSKEEIGEQPEDWFTQVYQEDRESLRQAISEHLEKQLEHFEFQYRYEHPQEGLRWILCRGVAVYNNDGTPSRMAGSQTDITERRMTAAIKEKTSLLEQSTFAVGIGIAQLNTEHQLLQTSPQLQKMLQDWNSVANWWHLAKNRIPWDTFPKEDTSQQWISEPFLLEQISPKGQRFVFEVVLTHPDNTFVSSDINHILLLKDITSRITAKEALQQMNVELTEARDTAQKANQAKSQFLANMSHELRTPLNAIIGYNELIQEELEEAEPDIDAVSKDLKRIRHSSGHLLQLISDILDLTRIEAGKLSTQHQQVSLTALLSELQAVTQYLAQQQNNVLHFRCDESCESIIADPFRLQQILLNLVSNACKFTENGNIHVSVEPKQEGTKQWIEFSVQDDGIGIKPQQLEKLFDSFYQVDNSATRKYGGMGLGLSICHQLCDLMDAKLDVESEFGNGSTFTVMLPHTLEENTTLPQSA